MQQLEIELKLQVKGKTRTKKRVLPTTWAQIPAEQRLPLLRQLLSFPGETGKIICLKKLLDLPAAWWHNLDEAQIAALTEAMPFLQLQPSAVPMLQYFEHRGTRYYSPAAHGENLVAIEYPIADEAFTAAVAGDEKSLRLLTATLCREASTDTAAVERRGDIRVPIESRHQAEARAERLRGLPAEAQFAALYFFAGMKEYVHRNFGKWLFNLPEDGEEQPVEQTSSLGWWSVYFSVATDGPFGKIDAVYQTAFLDICLYLVERRKREQEQAMQQRMAASDYGIPDAG